MLASQALARLQLLTTAAPVPERVDGGTLVANSYASIGRGFGATNAASAVLNVLGGQFNTSGAQPFVTGSYGNTTNVAITNVAYGSDGVTPGFINSQSEIQVGDDGGNGTFNVSNGGQVTSNNWLIVGRQGGVGTLNISGNGTITKSSNQGFFVGFSYSTVGRQVLSTKTAGQSPVQYRSASETKRLILALII